MSRSGYSDDVAKLVESARLAHATLTYEGIGTYTYMEGSEIYDDFRKAADSLTSALANFPAAASGASATPAPVAKTENPP